MKNFSKYIALFALAASLTSCESFFDQPIPYFVETPPPSLVVNAELSPSTRAVLEVSNSSPIFAYPEIPINWQKNATVVLFENGSVWDTLNFLPVPGQSSWLDSAFVSSKVVQPNKTYSVTVNATGFKTASASTQVPAPISPTSFTWLDPPNYLAKVRLEPLPDNLVYVIYFVSAQNIIYFRSNNPIVEFDSDDFIDIGGNEGGFYEGWIRSDRMNGQAQDVNFEFVYGVQDFQDVNIILSVLDKDLFTYRAGLKNYSGDNPFVEPVQVYSNVVDGYGIFSALAITQTPIQ